MKASFRVGGILLAAGAGRRFGNDKRRARLHDGTTLLQRSLDRFAAVCDTTLLVLGPREDVQALGLHLPPGVTVMNAPRSAGGMGFSLADAIGCAEAQAWDACLVSLGDKPFISERTLHTVRELLARHDFVVPTHGGAHGHPVGFARRYFAMLARLEGDAGARGLIREHGGEACFVELDDGGMLADVDTPEQLEALQRRFADV